MVLKPENKIQGKHIIPDWAQHKDSFTYVVQDAPNVFEFAHHRDSDNTQVASVKLTRGDVDYIKFFLWPRNPEIRTQFKKDVVQWLIKHDVEEVSNLTSEKFYQRLLLDFPDAKKTGRWMQFGKNPLIEVSWKVRR